MPTILCVTYLLYFFRHIYLISSSEISILFFTLFIVLFILMHSSSQSRVWREKLHPWYNGRAAAHCPPHLDSALQLVRCAGRPFWMTLTWFTIWLDHLVHHVKYIKKETFSLYLKEQLTLTVLDRAGRPFSMTLTRRWYCCGSFS